MRHFGRLVLLAGLTTGAVIASLPGCGIDQEKHLPGLPSQLPNRPGGDGFTGGSLDGGTTGGGGSCGAGGSSGVPSQSICDIIAASLTNDQTCLGCLDGNVTGTGACTTQKAACVADPACVMAQSACAACAQADEDPCIVACLDQSVVLQAFVACELPGCASSCLVPQPLACNVTDAGTDGG